jgi:hypothetical protein
MAYYTGDNLDKRVERFGLTELKELLRKVGDGTAVWPDACILTPPYPKDMETLRNLIYSLLYNMGLKPYFSVKLGPGCLILDQKLPDTKTGIKFGLPSPQPYYHEQNDVLGDEGLLDSFDDDEPASAGIKGE